MVAMQDRKMGMFVSSDPAGYEKEVCVVIDGYSDEDIPEMDLVVVASDLPKRIGMFLECANPALYHVVPTVAVTWKRV